MARGPLRAGLGDRSPNEVNDLIVRQLRRQVFVQHLALRQLPVGQLLTAGGGKGLRRFAALLGLAADHPDDVVVAEHAGLLAGDLFRRHRGQRHPDGGQPQLIVSLERGREVGLQAGFQVGHGATVHSKP